MGKAIILIFLLVIGVFAFIKNSSKKVYGNVSLYRSALENELQSLLNSSGTTLTETRSLLNETRNIDEAIDIYIKEARIKAYNNGLRDSMANGVAMKLAEQSYIAKFEKAINRIKG